MNHKHIHSILLLIAMTALPLLNASYDALSKHLWKHRVIAYTLDEGTRAELKAARHKYADAITERRLVFIFLEAPTYTQLAEQLGATPGRTELFLIGKDGSLKERIRSIDLPQLFTAIDQMPMRQREMRNDSFYTLL